MSLSSPELTPSLRILNEDILYINPQDILRDDFDGKLKPILDVVFVRLFDGEDDYALLRCFLNDFLRLEGEDRITRVEQVYTHILDDHPGEQDPNLVLLAADQGRRYLQVEVQLLSQAGYLKRDLYHAAKVHNSEHNRRGFYGRMAKTVCIHILSWNLFPPVGERDPAITRLQMCDVMSGRSITDQIQLWYAELSKFKCKAEELSTRQEKWMYFLKYADQLSPEEVKFLDMPELLQCDARLRVISREYNTRLAYLSKMKAEHAAAHQRHGSR